MKTTGGKGLHVVVPLRRGLSWDEHKDIAHAIVEEMAAASPALYTTNMAKAQRKNRIFLDYLRNGRSATFIAPYSPRARPGAPVALPIEWEELAQGVDPTAFTLARVPAIVAARRRDPWDGIDELDQKPRV